MTESRDKLNVEPRCINCGNYMLVVEQNSCSGEQENTIVYTNTYKCASCEYKAKIKITRQLAIDKEAPDNTFIHRLKHYMVRYLYKIN